MEPLHSINSLFFVKRGKGDYRENLGKGSTPLISATNTDNGVIDHVDIKPTFKAPAITVERVSGHAFVQVLDFATVPDDIAVLVPRKEMSMKMLFFVAAQINMKKWRFSYARKLTPKRLELIEINLNEFKEGDLGIERRFPKAAKKVPIEHNSNLRIFNITELFKPERGDFHALDRLDEGSLPTVSRISEDNGVTGYYDMPENAKLYQKGLLTISTVTGDAFIQVDDFIATDNVLICKPKRAFRLTTLFFIAMMLHLQKWRFSYGRQPYERIFSKTNIFLPVVGNGKDIDEDYIEELVNSRYGWGTIQEKISIAPAVMASSSPQQDLIPYTKQ